MQQGDVCAFFSHSALLNRNGRMHVEAGITNIRHVTLMQVAKQNRHLSAAISRMTSGICVIEFTVLIVLVPEYGNWLLSFARRLNTTYRWDAETFEDI